MADIDWSEHYIRRGDPSKPTYYVIRRAQSDVGLFSNFGVFAGHIRYALSNGWLPVVDMQNYPNAYLPPDKLGKENAWEYFFEQPLRIGLDTAYGGENVILSNAEPVLPFPDGSMNFYENRDGILTEWRMLVKLGLLKVKPALVTEALSVRQKLFAPDERVLGVHLRGTDYGISKLPYHPIPPPVEFAASIVLDKLQEWNCNKIFLATEDKTIAKIFKDVFGNICVLFDKEYINYNSRTDQSAAVSRINRPNDHFMQGKEYLTEMILLTTCNSFVAGRTSGSTGVMMLADKFEHTYFFNLGRYGVITLD